MVSVADGIFEAEGNCQFQEKLESEIVSISPMNIEFPSDIKAVENIREKFFSKKSASRVKL
jgi:hypothetical protein